MGERKSAGKFQEAAERFAWEVMSASVRLEELRNAWARKIGISGPQWMILTVLANTEDRQLGLPVGAVSRALRVDQSFVVTQSKALEKNGFLHRKVSPDDGRVVNLSLTDQAASQIATLGSKRTELNEFIYSDFDSARLAELSCEMGAIKERLEKAILKLSAGI